MDKFHDNALKKLEEFLQAAEQTALPQYELGKQDVMRNLLSYVNKSTNGDLRNMNLHTLIHYLEAKRKQIEPRSNEDVVLVNNKKQSLQTQNRSSQQIHFNFDRFLIYYSKLNLDDK
ncbi:hypothetical protein pb186bvf_012090 [Paramecium bursaria]